MQIEYVVTKSKRIVSDAIGERLVKIGIARRVSPLTEGLTKTLVKTLEPSARPRSGPPAPIPEGESTPKRKRRYKRKDIQAEGNE